MTNFSYRSAITCFLLVIGFNADGQTINLYKGISDIDRWVYPFNTAPGYELDGKVFSALGQENAFPPLSFDQRDGQFLVGFDLDDAIPTGRGRCGYRVLTAVVTLRVSNDLVFRYDATYDPWTSYLAGMTDTDGRPVEMYGAAFRAGWMPCLIDPAVPALNQFPCYFEGSPSLPGPPFGPGSFPTSGTRYAYPTDFAARSPRDVSNNVRDQFDPVPFAVGQISGLGAGALVPVDSAMVFELNVAHPDVQAYLREACHTGVLRLIATSLQPATSGSGGGPGTGAFASFYCKEIEIEGFPASLSMTVRLTPSGDADASGTVDFADITEVLTQWGSVGPDGDANCDGAVNFSDITDVLTNWGMSG